VPFTAIREPLLRAFCLTIFMCLALALPGVAAAQTPTDDVYDPIDERTETRASSSGDLPLTGGDLVLVALAGTAILGTGFAIRRASQAD
jgi:hypothetical protein